MLDDARYAKFVIIALSTIEVDISVRVCYDCTILLFGVWLDMQRKAYYSPEEVAEHFGVDPETIRRMARDGKIPGARRIGRLWRIPAEFLDKPLDTGEGDQPEERG
jgi:excisionase family DNA binding protein